MSASPPPQFCSKDHGLMVENLASSGKERRLASPGMPKRYESDEEEMSEADTPGREENYFSTTDLESDTGVSERDDDTLMLKMSTEHSRPTSVYTVKPGGHSNVLSPMPLLHRQHENHESNTTFRPDSPSRHQPFHSEAAPFEEDQIVDVHFLTATPVTYYTPTCKPSIVFVSHSRVSTGGRNVNKKPKKPRSGSVTRLPSTSSSRSNNGSIKRRCRPRVGKDADHRSSTLATEVHMNAHLFTAETFPSFSDDAAPPSSRGSRSSSVYSRSEAEAASWSADPEDSRWPASQQSSTGANRGTRAQPSRAGRKDEVPVYRQRSHSSGQRARGYRRQGSNVASVSDTTGTATSRPRQHLSNQTAASSNPHKTYRPPPHPSHPTASESSYATEDDANTQENTSQFGAWRDPSDPSHAPFDGSHSRRRSVVSESRRQSMCSTASGSSKPNMSAFEARSVRSIISRHRRHQDSGSTSSAQSSFGRNSAFSEYGDSSGGSRPTSNVGYYARASSDITSSPWRMDGSRASGEHRREGEHPEAQRAARLKGAKWFSDRSETVNHAKNKAVNGIGSMLKRTAYPE